MGHALKDALDRQELTEEEAYFILRFVGHLGYKEAIAHLDGGRLRRARRWLFWSGGWEHLRLAQWDRNKPAWEVFQRDSFTRRWKLCSPTPWSLFGHRNCGREPPALAGSR
jgi:hypothetical protein